LDQFEYRTTDLWKFILGRADHFRIIRKSVMKIPELVVEMNTTVTSKTAAKTIETNAAETAKLNATETAATKAAEIKAAGNWTKAVGNQRLADKKKVKMREIGFSWLEEVEESFQAV